MTSFRDNPFLPVQIYVTYFFPLVLSEINNSFVSLNTKGKFRSTLELALIIVRVHTWRTD